MDITAWIWERLESDLKLSEDAKYLVGAAVEGEDEFSALVAKAVPFIPAASAGDELSSEPAKAFLKSIQVEGFRGIGRKSTLTFRPAPGLIVVAGRNGSGKSSFADALQVALNPRSVHEKRHPSLGGDQWRNLHHPHPATIEVALAVEGQGDTLVGVDWSAQADIDGLSSWSQLPGQQRNPGQDVLAWTRPLDLYSPMLSYDELGGIFDGRPSELYDALEGFLGLGQITDAAVRLARHVKALKAPGLALTVAVDTGRVQPVEATPAC